MATDEQRDGYVPPEQRRGTPGTRRPIRDPMDPSQNIFLESVSEFERKEAQDTSLRGFINAMATNRPTYAAIASALNGEDPEQIALPASLAKYRSDINLPHMATEIAVLDAIPSLSLDHKFALLVDSALKRCFYPEPVEELFVLSESGQTLDACRQKVTDNKSKIDHWRFQNLVAIYRQDPERFIHSLGSLHNLLMMLPDDSPIKKAAQRARNVAFPQQDTIGRLGLVIRTIDDMQDLDIMKKEQFFTLAYMLLYPDQLAASVPKLQTVLSLLIDRTPFMSTTSLPTFAERNRFMRIMRKATLVESIMRQNLDKDNVEEVLSAEVVLSSDTLLFSNVNCWVYEAIMNPSNNLLGWDELGQLFPQEFGNPGDSYKTFGNRIRHIANKLEEQGLLPKISAKGTEISRTNREQVRKHERISRITQYIISHNKEDILPEALSNILDGCSERTIRRLLAEMRKEEEQLPENQRIIPLNLHEAYRGPTPESLTLINEINRMVLENAEELHIDPGDVRLSDEYLLQQLNQQPPWENLQLGQMQGIISKYRDQILMEDRRK